MTEPDPLEPPLASPADPPEAQELEDRRYPSTIGGLFYLVVLAATGIGLVIVWREDWRLGIRVIAAALAFAAVARLVLPTRDAGMLAVRHRMFDVVLLGTFAGLLAFLSVTIPDRSL